MGGKNDKQAKLSHNIEEEQRRGEGGLVKLLCLPRPISPFTSKPEGFPWRRGRHRIWVGNWNGRGGESRLHRERLELRVCCKGRGEARSTM
eukprot:6632280-Prorocentrum_lima.AAC.1